MTGERPARGPGRRKRWEDLSPRYRRRLERQGITPERHASNAPLYKARGHGSRTRERTARRIRQLSLITDEAGVPYISPQALAKARKEKGDRWVLNRLEELRDARKARSKGNRPFRRNPTYTRYSDPAEVGEKDPRTGLYPVWIAPFYWYHGNIT